MFLPSYWIASLVLSVVGLALFIYGRRAPSFVVGLAGIALMGEPLFIFNSRVLWLVGSVTLVLAIAVQSVVTRQKRSSTGPASA